MSPPEDDSPSWSCCVQKRLSALDRVDQRLGLEPARRRDQPHLQLARAPALADDEQAQEALARPPVPGRQALQAAPFEHRLADRVRALGGEQAVVQRLDPVPAARRVEAADQLAVVARAERVLELVAVAPLLDGGDDRLELEVLELADPLQRLADLGGLDLELALVRQHLPGGARVRRGGRDAVGRGLEHLDRARLGVGALGLADDRAHAVARHGAGDEDDVALEPGDAVAAVGQRVDGQLEHVAARRPYARRGGHTVQDDTRLTAQAETSSSSSAFWTWRRFSAWSQIRCRSP